MHHLHHTDIFMHGTQQFDDLILYRVGILVFINQDVLKLMLVFDKASGTDFSNS